jgi:hypothetical protein
MPIRLEKTPRRQGLSLQQFLLGIFRPASPATPEKSARGHDVSDMGPYAGKREEAGDETSGRLPEGFEPTVKNVTPSVDLMTVLPACVERSNMPKFL